MRIFIGRSGLANIAASYAQGFRDLGHQVFTSIEKRHPFFAEFPYDLVLEDRLLRIHRKGNGLAGKYLNILRTRRLLYEQFFEAIRHYDLFIFIFGSSLLPGYADFPLLKLSGKRIVCTFWGSDTRYGYAFEQEMKLLGMAEEVRPFIEYAKNVPGTSYSHQLGVIQAAERYADLILSQPGNGQLQSRPYMRSNIPLDLSRFRFQIPDREIPLVLHAPSNRGPKGTEFVLAAVDQLQREGLNFEFRLIEKMPHRQVCELLTESDIVVDELFADTVGVLSSESMASGNAVLVRYPEQYAKVPPGCPALNVTKDTLAENLRRVIEDRELRRRLAFEGRAFVEKYHDAVKVTQQMLDWLKPGGIQEYDFTPTFYKTFKMPPELACAEREREHQERIRHYANRLFNAREPY